MKIKLLYILAFFVMFSCQNEKEAEEVIIDEKIEKTEPISKQETNESSPFTYNHLQEFSDSTEIDRIIPMFDQFNLEDDGISIYSSITGKVLLNASKRLLEVKEVENLYKGDIEIIRNTIYARHGYKFKSKKMKYLFEELVTWYQPLYDDVSSEITEIEIKNIALLKRYEEFAEEFSISFAR